MLQLTMSRPDIADRLLSVTSPDMGSSYVHARTANFRGLVLGCIEAKFLQENMRLKALVEIYTMHSFAQLFNSVILTGVMPRLLYFREM